MTAPVGCGYGRDQNQLWPIRAAVLALNVLQPRDFFGLTAVDTKVNTVVPLGTRRLQTGATNSRILVDHRRRRRHLHLHFAGWMPRESCVIRAGEDQARHPLFRRRRRRGKEAPAKWPTGHTAGSGNSVDVVSSHAGRIRSRLSVVGLGSGTAIRTWPFFASWPNAATVDFYLTNDATTLPQIFSTETMKVAQSSLVEEPFNPVPAVMPSPLTAGIDWKNVPAAPGLQHYQDPNPRRKSLLVHRNSASRCWLPGAMAWGRLRSFTSDAKARWAGEWLTWDGYGKFWAQVVRGLLRKSDQAAFQVRAVERADGSRLQLDIDALTAEGGFRDRLPIDVTALDTATGQTHALRAEQVAPGSYRAEFDLPARGRSGRRRSDHDVLGVVAGVDGAALRLRPHAELSAGVPAHGHRRGVPARGRGGRVRAGSIPLPEEVFAPPTRFSTRRKVDLTNDFL